MIFRSYKDKQREQYCTSLRQFWNDLSHDERKNFRRDYFGLYLTIMVLTDWNETL